MLDVTLPENVSIFGAGDPSVRGGGDQTIIYDDIDDDESLIKLCAAGNFELAGITARGGTGQLKNNRVIQFGGNALISVHHLTVNTSTYSVSGERKGGALRTTGGIYGVIWECSLDAYQGCDAWRGSSGDPSWAEPSGIGGPNFVVLEDCDFTSRGGSICDNGAGGRIVVRYCVCNHLNTHGTGGANRNRGIRAFEFYKNLLINSDPDAVKDNAVMICGGTGVVWGNTCQGLYKTCVRMKIHRNNDDTYTQKPTPDGWGYAGTNFNGTGSYWDGNDDQATGYPMLDMPGRGQGDLLSGKFPDVTNSDRGEPCYPEQQLEAIYIWDNEWQKVPNYADSKYIGAPGYIQEGREYCLEPMPGYEPYPYPHPLRT